MKLECSCGGIAFSTRRRRAGQGDADKCAACKQPGHIAVTDDYEEDCIARWHLDSECASGAACYSLYPVARTASPIALAREGSGGSDGKS